MAELKREYVVPLRRKCLRAPKWRRSKKAIAVLKDYMRKHMKCENVIVCSELNEHIWARGSKYPPGKVEVVALKSDFGNDEKVLVNLKEFGIDSQREVYGVQLQPQETNENKNAKESESSDSKDDNKNNDNTVVDIEAEEKVEESEENNDKKDTATQEVSKEETKK